ncbi:MAG: ubiquinone biosynthesis accessory factor UbiJ [Gammaproteobacteria bacterium]
MNEARALPELVLAPAARALNAALAADPVALHMLGELAGRRIAVELSDLSLVVVVSIASDRIALGGPVADPEATVSGRLTSLLAAARSGTARGLNVAGDAELVQGLARVMGRLPGAIWERVARSIGDVPARGLERFSRTVLQIFGDTRDRFAESLAEYLQYEARVVAPRADVSDFLGEVDRLRSDVERLAKRVERLRHASQREGQ